MTKTLKFGAIVDRAELDLWTAQYVLKHAPTDFGLPKAGGRGNHRHFTIPQAVKLAVHTQLVMSGLILEVAVKAMKYCDGVVKAHSNNQEHFSYLIDDPQYKWLVTIQESRYVNIWSEYLMIKAAALKSVRGKSITLDIKHEYYDTKTDKTDFQSENDALVQCVLNITMLERRIQSLVGV